MDTVRGADPPNGLDALDVPLSPTQRLAAAILNRCVLDWRQLACERADVLGFLRSEWGYTVCAQIGTDAEYIVRRLRKDG